MDGVACPLRREKRDKEINRCLRLARVVVIALEVLARSEDVEVVLGDGDVPTRPIANLFWYEAHMFNIPARIGLQTDYGSEQKSSYNPIAQ